MRTFYFVGGPINGQREAFLRRLSDIGGSPPGWRIYAHANRDGQALHIVETVSEASILAHIARFDPIYERGPIVEVMPGNGLRPSSNMNARARYPSRITSHGPSATMSR